MRTHVTFRSDRFDAALPDDEALDAAHGLKLAAWLSAALGAVGGLSAAAPEREEWGWRFLVRAGAQRVTLSVGPVAEPVPEWVVVATPAVELRVDQDGLGRVLGALHELLSRTGGIRDIGWHEAAVFDRGVADPGATPFTPPSWERA